MARNRGVRAYIALVAALGLATWLTIFPYYLSGADYLPGNDPRPEVAKAASALLMGPTAFVMAAVELLPLLLLIPVCLAVCIGYYALLLAPSLAARGESRNSYLVQ